MTIWLASAFMAILLAAMPTAARATDPGHADACLINRAIEAASDLEAGHASRFGWDCSEQAGEPKGGDWSLRFDIAPRDAVPKILWTRMGYFDVLQLSVRDQQGQWAIARYRLGDLHSTLGEPMIAAALPHTEGRPVTVIASFVGNGHGLTLTRARLLPAPPPLDNVKIAKLLALAALVGMLLVPIALEAAFYRVLRQRFLAWHIALSLSFALLIVIRSGAFGLIAPLPADLWRIALIMAMGLTIACSLMFLRHYIEPEKLSPALRAILPGVALWTIAISAVHAASFEVLRPLAGNLHAIGMSVPMTAMLLAMGDAARRRSRAVFFLLAGWAPIILASMVQIVTHVMPFGLQHDLLPLLYSGVMSEGLATAMGVADRFFALRRERDQALSEALELGRLSQHDGLTGLLNRRALEMRFDQLRAQGFDTMALLDLDQFKDINDRFGHQVGDAVLVACAGALRADQGRDSVAARLGGEEFMILSRGDRALQIVEGFRQALTTRIASKVQGLDRPITASMGVIRIPERGLKGMNFAELYARADQLLYEAKQAGRNRTVHERLMMTFEERRTEASPAEARIA